MCNQCGSASAFGKVYLCRRQHHLLISDVETAGDGPPSLIHHVALHDTSTLLTPICRVWLVHGVQCSFDECPGIFLLSSLWPLLKKKMKLQFQRNRSESIKLSNFWFAVNVKPKRSWPKAIVDKTPLGWNSEPNVVWPRKYLNSQTGS